jgi:DNA-binding transcriptional ArsR family regulator
MWSAGIPRHFPKNLPHTPEGRSDCSDTVAGLGADVWRWSALGKVAKRLWDAMEGQTTRELTRAFGSSLRTVQRHLRKLKDKRLSEQSKDGRWHRLERDLVELAKELGVAGDGSRQRERHLFERLLYQRHRLGPSGKIKLVIETSIEAAP